MASREHARTREVVARQQGAALVLYGRGATAWLACETPLDLEAWR